MRAIKNAPDAAGTAIRSAWEKNQRYYTALEAETQAPATDYGMDTYAAPRKIRRMTKEDRERSCMDFEL